MAEPSTWEQINNPNGGKRSVTNWSSKPSEDREAEEFVRTNIRNIAELRGELQSMKFELNEMVNLLDKIESKREIVAAELQSLGDYSRNKRNEWLYDQLREDKLDIRGLIEGNENNAGLIVHINKLLSDSREVDATSKGNTSAVLEFKREARRVVANEIFDLWVALKKALGRTETTTLSMVNEAKNLEAQSLREVEEKFRRFHEVVFKKETSDEDILRKLMDFLKSLENLRGDSEQFVLLSFKNRRHEKIETDSKETKDAKMEDLYLITKNYFQYFDQPIEDRMNRIDEALEGANNKYTDLNSTDMEEVDKLHKEFREKLTRGTKYEDILKDLGKIAKVEKLLEDVLAGRETFVNRVASEYSLTETQLGTVSLFHVKNAAMKNTVEWLMTSDVLETRKENGTNWAGIGISVSGNKNFKFHYRSEAKPDELTLTLGELDLAVKSIMFKLDKRTNGRVFPDKKFHDKRISEFLNAVIFFFEQIIKEEVFTEAMERQPEKSAIYKQTQESKFKDAKEEYEEFRDTIYQKVKARRGVVFAMLVIPLTDNKSMTFRKADKEIEKKPPKRMPLQKLEEINRVLAPIAAIDNENEILNKLGFNSTGNVNRKGTHGNHSYHEDFAGGEGHINAEDNLKREYEKVLDMFEHKKQTLQHLLAEYFDEHGAHIKPEDQWNELVQKDIASLRREASHYIRILGVYLDSYLNEVGKTDLFSAIEGTLKSALSKFESNINTYQKMVLAIRAIEEVSEAFRG